MDIDTLLGMTEDEAVKALEIENLEARIVRRDDEYFVGIMDYRLDRVNLEIEDGVVVKVVAG